MQDFEGKVAVVTGAASGMGRAFAERFAAEGMKVVLADVEEPALEAAVIELQHQEYDVLGVHTDVSKQESVESLAQRAIEAYGKIHVVCNNAGVGGERGMIWEETQKAWDYMMGVNFWGVVHGIRVFVPKMLEHGEEGHIVNTASIAGLGPGWGIYGVTKHAVVAMTEWLSQNLQMVDAKINASVLCPSGVATNITSTWRNRPEELQEDSSTPSSIQEMRIKRYRERMTAAVAAGKQPAEIAEIVLDAIKNNDFYILTHPEQEEWRVRSRAEMIVSRKGPTPSRLIMEEDWSVDEIVRQMRGEVPDNAP
ncbi:MAG TPA: SDR family NAD(P)-dependent oxidoreductase [Dehalococcoidia bacterium]|nr:SDR family NAD(P)-dependent oxidoreductase [Dehalococcoidia bacterium]